MHCGLGWCTCAPREAIQLLPSPSRLSAMSQLAAMVSKAGSPKELALRGGPSSQTTFETSNRYVQSYLSYDLFNAVNEGSLTDVRNLLLSYPDLDLNFHIRSTTPLSQALYKRHFLIFQLLVRHHERTGRLDLDVASRDHLGRVEPPLVTACRMHFPEGVVALVEQGADIDAADGLGHTALWVAARQQMPDLVDYLVARGASVNKVDRYRCTPLLAALMYRVSSIILKKLIISGSWLGSPGRVPAAEQSPLFWAAKHGQVEIVRLVLQAGVPMAQARAVKMALANSDLDPEVVALLETAARTPRSLCHQCRFVIRSHISRLCQGKLFVKNIEGLPLPLSVRQFLLLAR